MVEPENRLLLRNTGYVIDHFPFPSFFFGGGADIICLPLIKPIFLAYDSRLLNTVKCVVTSFSLYLGDLGVMGDSWAHGRTTGR